MRYPIEIFKKLTDKELHQVMTEVSEFNHGVNRNKDWILRGCTSKWKRNLK